MSDLQEYAQQSPKIVKDSNGVKHAVWTGRDPDHGNYFLAKYSKTIGDGNLWTPWVNVSPMFEDQDFPDIAVASDGTIHIVWAGEDSSNSSAQIKYVRSVDGGTTWSSWINIVRIRYQRQYLPKIEIDSLGVLHVVWYGEDNTFGNYQQIKHSKSTDVGDTWSPYINISTTSGVQIYKQSFTIDSNDTLHVVAETLYVDDKVRYFSSSDGGSTWSGPTTIDSSTGIYQSDPAIVTDNNGYIYIFARVTAGDSHIYVSKSIDGGTSWSTFTLLESTGAADQYSVSAHLDTFTNNIHVVFSVDNPSRTDDFRTTKYTKSSDGGSTWATLVDIDPISDADEYQRFPSVVSNNGNIDVISSSKYLTDTSQQIKHAYSSDDGTTWSQMTNLEFFSALLISTAQELYDIRNDLSGNYMLANDIDLNVAPYNQAPGWVPIGDDTTPFTGYLDFNGYTVKNLMFDYVGTGDVNNIGLIGTATNAKLLNPKISANINIATDNGATVEYISALAAKINNTELSNIKISSNITIDAGSSGQVRHVGSVAGKLDQLTKEFTDVQISGSIDIVSEGDTRYVGSAIGQLINSNIFNLNTIFNDVDVTVSNNSAADIFGVGGVFGSLESNTSNLSNLETRSTLTVSSPLLSAPNGLHVGGVIGLAVGTMIVEDIKLDGSVIVTNVSNVGGVAGSGQNVTFKRCVVSGAAIKGFSKVGGIVGQEASGTIQDSVSAVDAIHRNPGSGHTSFGRITGESSGTLSGNYAENTMQFIQD